jgi:hypothetical protein
MKQNKYLPELVIGWILAVSLVVGLTSCTSSRNTSTRSTRVVQGTSEWKYVELRGNKH